MINIISEDDINSYIEYFKLLNEKEIQFELDIWEEKIKKDDYTSFEFLTFLRILDIMDNTEVDAVSTVDILSSTIKELNILSDNTLDHYEGSSRQVDLLDDINKSINECELLYKYYNEKIIN